MAPDEKQHLRRYGKKDSPQLKEVDLHILSESKKWLLTDYFKRTSPEIDTTKHQQEKKLRLPAKEHQQFHLAFGQKGAGGGVLCEECGMRYNAFLQQDLFLHQRFHDYKTQGFLLKNIRLEDALPFVPRVQPKDCSRILVLCVTSKSNSVLYKKALVLLSLATTELGSPSLSYDELKTSKLFIYVKDYEACGIAVAEQICRSWCFFKDTSLPLREYGTTIGISRIWVSRKHRREGLGTTLVDCVRRFFFPEGEIDRSHLAFSQTTRDGALFAKAYFNTSSSLLYVRP